MSLHRKDINVTIKITNFEREKITNFGDSLANKMVIFFSIMVSVIGEREEST